MSHQFNYNLPNYTRLHQNPQFYTTHQQTVSEEDRINGILHNTSSVFFNSSIPSYHQQPFQSVITSQLINWHLSSCSPGYNNSKSTGSITSSNQIPEETSQTSNKQTETEIVGTYRKNWEKDKSHYNFHFLIPHYSPKIHRWKKSTRSKECEKVTQLPQNTTQTECLDQLKHQPIYDLNPVVAEELFDESMNVQIIKDPEIESEAEEKLLTSYEEVPTEILSISMMKNDIEKIISIAKRRKQEAHAIYELIKLSIVVIRSMTHKQVMCHWIRGRQRGKRKKKFLQFYFHLVIRFHHSNSLQLSFLTILVDVQRWTIVNIINQAFLESFKRQNSRNL